MNKTLPFVGIWLLLSIGLLSAQSLERVAVSSGGNYGAGSSGSLSYTFGQTWINTAENPGGTPSILTQGFQQLTQPELINVSIRAQSMMGMSMRLFPNPAVETTQLELTSDKIRTVDYTVFDMRGRKVLTSTEAIHLRAGATETLPISLAGLSEGTYTLLLRNLYAPEQATIRFQRR
ncbi:MAG: T9SS type A sorting domain-containing protein [Bacteroidota bacterium]